MSTPVTALEFDDAIDSAWSRFRADLVARVTTLVGGDDEQSVEFARELAGADADSVDVAVRRLHEGLVVAVVAVDAAAGRAAHSGWARTGPHHLSRVATAGTVGELVDAVIVIARDTWGVTHPSFLRARPTASATLAHTRAAAMADHPSGGIARVVRRVVAAQLAGVVEVDHYRAIELRYPGAVVHLQIWEVERSAMLWTTITGGAEADRVDRAHEIMRAWPDLELVVEGSVMDVEFPVDLSESPSRSIAAALTRWHAFMTDGHPALVAAVVRPDDVSDAAVPAPLRAVLRRHRDGRPVSVEQVDRLHRLGRAQLLAGLDQCRRQSLSWMTWADHRTQSDDADGAALACSEAQMWDDAYVTVGAALRRAVSSPT